MTRKIFRTSLLVGLAALALSAGLFSWALVRHFTAKVYEELMVEVRLAAQGVRLGGRDYLEAVDSPARLTWIGGDGTVLFDTAAQAEGMDNHLDRPEIRDALSRGLGRDSRLSDTLSERTLYAALALEDGTVLRVASRQKSAAALLAALAPEAALIVAVTALLSALLAGPLARRIIRPILELDLSRPDQCRCYEELAPLLCRLRSQQETIRAQTDELRQRREEFTAITENMSEGFLLIDRRMDLLSCNASALRLLGAPEAAPGESVLRLSRAESFCRVVEEALSGRHSEALLEGEPAEVEGVRHVLEEMIGNLVDNGVKYNRPGGSVAVAVGRREGLARLTVRDTGIGIPPAHQQRVFERFYRVDKSHSREVGGTGLGLSIVKHAAAYHGAALELESREGEGTAVTVQWR